MNILILSDSDKISSDLQLEFEKASYSFDFCNIQDSKGLLERLMHTCDYSASIFHSLNENVSLDSLCTLFYIAGNLNKYILPVYTNIKAFSDNIHINSNINFEENISKMMISLKSHEEKLISERIQRKARVKLVSLGIPFTADCFSLYIHKNDMEICNLFLEANIDVNLCDEFGTPLLNNAVRVENTALVKKLIEAGANINTVSEDRGYTPIMDAVFMGNLELTKIFIDLKADINTINKEGQTNLVLAVGADRTEICKLLVENGADPDVKDQMGMSAYNYASLFKKKELIEILSPYHKE